MSDASDEMAWIHLLSDQLLDAVDKRLVRILPATDYDTPGGMAANTAVNAIRAVIGRTMARFPQGLERDAVKVALAPTLGNPLGQLLSGQPDRVIAACLEGHAQLAGLAMGAETRVSVTITMAAAPVHPHLKVVQ